MNSGFLAIAVLAFCATVFARNIEVPFQVETVSIVKAVPVFQIDNVSVARSRPTFSVDQASIAKSVAAFEVDHVSIGQADVKPLCLPSGSLCNPFAIFLPNRCCGEEVCIVGISVSYFHCQIDWTKAAAAAES